ncbi:acrB/AcrD/AcrF family protein, partial [Vibrio parahaemolyticus V-223/04]
FILRQWKVLRKSSFVSMSAKTAKMLWLSFTTNSIPIKTKFLLLSLTGL